MGGHVTAQGRTDVVTLPNGDRITGEVVRLDRGRLEFKTDDAGTLYLEWDKLATVQATRPMEVVTEDGRRFLGSLGPAASRMLRVVGSDEPVSVSMAEVTIIRQIGSSFWSKLDGSIDAGYSYTRSSGVVAAERQLGHVLSHPRGAGPPDGVPQPDAQGRRFRDRRSRHRSKRRTCAIHGSAGSSPRPAGSRPTGAWAWSCDRRSGRRSGRVWSTAIAASSGSAPDSWSTTSRASTSNGPATSRPS